MKEQCCGNCDNIVPYLDKIYGSCMAPVPVWANEQFGTDVRLDCRTPCPCWKPKEEESDERE